MLERKPSRTIWDTLVGRCKEHLLRIRNSKGNNFLPLVGAETIQNQLEILLVRESEEIILQFTFILRYLARISFYWMQKLQILYNVQCTCMYMLLKVPKREIFDHSDFPDFYTIKASWVGDLLVKILTYNFNFWES